MDKLASLPTNKMAKSPETYGDPYGIRTRIPTLRGRATFSISATLLHFPLFVNNGKLRLSPRHFVVCLQTCQLMRTLDSKSYPLSAPTPQIPRTQPVSATQSAGITEFNTENVRHESGKVVRRAV